jgi:hypothetical protein
MESFRQLFGCFFELSKYLTLNFKKCCLEICFYFWTGKKSFWSGWNKFMFQFILKLNLLFFQFSKVIKSWFEMKENRQRSVTRYLRQNIFFLQFCFYALPWASCKFEVIVYASQRVSVAQKCFHDFFLQKTGSMLETF